MTASSSLLGRSKLKKGSSEFLHECRGVIFVGLVQCVTPGQVFFWFFSLSLYVWFKA